MPNTEDLVGLLREKDDEIKELNKELREISNAATVFQMENQNLKDQLKLLQPPPPRRRWCWMWLGAT